MDNNGTPGRQSWHASPSTSSWNYAAVAAAGSSPPTSPPLPRPTERRLTHRISNISDITDLDSYRDLDDFDDGDADDRPKARPSLVSLQSYYEPSPAPTPAPVTARATATPGAAQPQATADDIEPVARVDSYPGAPTWTNPFTRPADGRSGSASSAARYEPVRSSYPGGGNFTLPATSAQTPAPAPPTPQAPPAASGPSGPRNPNRSSNRHSQGGASRLQRLLAAYETIKENEEYNMSLLAGAAPPGQSDPSMSSPGSGGVGSTSTKTTRPQSMPPLSSSSSSSYRPYAPIPERDDDDRGLGRGRGGVEDAVESTTTAAAATLAPTAVTEAETAVSPIAQLMPSFTFMGPASAQDQEFLRSLQQQEASGKLTRGLGSGLRSVPTIKIKGSALLATSPTTAERGGGWGNAGGYGDAGGGGLSSSISRGLSRSLSRNLSRSFTRRGRTGVGVSVVGSTGEVGSQQAQAPTTTNMTRKATLRGLGQREANKRGEVVEVVMEEDEEDDDEESTVPGADISAVVGPDVLFAAKDNAPGMRSSTFPVARSRRRRQRTETFYPQPDWKPFSMRWPYLVLLIVLSLGLGATQEAVFQLSQRRGGLLRFDRPTDIPPGQYFAFKFAPMIFAVTYGVLWQLTDFEVNRLEAFYQLSRPGGALADESINVDYATAFHVLRPFRAVRLRHYAVALSSVATFLAVSLVPTLGAASIALAPDRAARVAHPDAEKTIVVRAVWSRLLTATFAVVALLAAALLHQLQSRKSGLQGDVKGIAGLASMAVVSHILMDFKGTDRASPAEIHARLKGRRYVLRNSSLAPYDDDDDDDDDDAVAKGKRSSTWLTGTTTAAKTGNVAATPTEDVDINDDDEGNRDGTGAKRRSKPGSPARRSSSHHIRSRSPSVDHHHHPTTSPPHKPDNPHPLMLRPAGALPFLAGIALFLIFLPVILFTPASWLTDRAPWVVTVLAVCLKLGWGSLETDVRVVEPYLVLSRRHAPPATLCLDYVGLPFAALPVRALLNGHWLVALVGFGSVMAEVLTVLVTSLATVEGHDFLTAMGRDGGAALGGGPTPDSASEINAGQETALSFLVSLSLSGFVLVYMLCVAAAVFARRRHPFLPRRPNTIAAVLAFIHQSKMLWDFVGTAKLSGADTAKRLEALGKTYGLGWFEGRDGQVHCGVDEEELAGSYVHGVDGAQGNKPWNVQWDLF